MQLYPFLMPENRDQSIKERVRIEAPYYITISRMTKLNGGTWPTTSKGAGFHLQPHIARYLLDRVGLPKQRQLSRYLAAAKHRS